MGRRMGRRASSPARAAPAASAFGVALAGSGGGSTRRASPTEEVAATRAQLAALGATLTHVQLVSCAVPLDRAGPGSAAELWLLEQGHLNLRVGGTLRDVNAAAHEADSALAEAIERGEVSALLLVSSDVKGVNCRSLDAAVRMRVPVCGSGGASLGLAAEAGAMLLEVSGSVGTTPHTRAMGVASALARHWQRAYVPALPPPDLAPLPLLDALLPGFLACLLVGALARTAETSGVAGALAPGQHAASAATRACLPLAAATLAGARAAQLGESGVLAGALAGGLLHGAAGGGSTVAAGLAAGAAAGCCCRAALRHSYRLGLPATAATLYTVGGSAVAGGLAGAAVAPAAALATAALRVGLVAPTRLPTAAAALAGAAMGVGTKLLSLHGWYHAALFPLILVEMEGGAMGGAPALLGALDAACLCAVCAGVCAAVALSSAAPEERRACRRAVRTNLLFGDFVEACYPYMAEHRGVHAAALCGAAIAGALVVADDARSSAYLPLPLSAAVATRPATFALACAAAFGVPFLGTLCCRTGQVRRA